MIWHLSHRADAASAVVADRHYSRQKPGTPQFVPPGRCLVLRAEGPQVWVTSWPFPQYTKHAWAGAWVCSMYRREGGEVASEAIRQAVAVTRWRWPDAPSLGIVTFVNRSKVRPVLSRGEAVYGWTFRRAGFVEVGETKGGLLALQLLPSQMPGPARPLALFDMQRDT